MVDFFHDVRSYSSDNAGSFWFPNQNEYLILSASGLAVWREILSSLEVALRVSVDFSSIMFDISQLVG